MMIRISNFLIFSPYFLSDVDSFIQENPRESNRQDLMYKNEMNEE